MSTYAEAAAALGSSAATVSRLARELGIPRPLTPDDVDRIGIRRWGPYSGCPRFEQRSDGHFGRVSRDDR